MNCDSKEFIVKAPWGNIALVSWGDPANPPVLMVHGRRDTAATFVPIVQLLPKSFYYVALDMPGNGKSDHFPKGIVISRYHLIPVIDYVVEHMGWKQFIYMGHSMGCETGLFWNAIKPGIISKFIHLDPGPTFQRLQPLEPQLHFQRYFERYYGNYHSYNTRIKEYTKTEVIQAVMKARGLTEAQAELVLCRSLLRTPSNKYRLSFDSRSKYIAPQNNVNSYYKQLFTRQSPPSLIISMSEGAVGYIHGAREAEELIAHLMECRYTYRIFLVGGHDHHFTNAEEVAKYVSDFLCKDFSESKSKL